MIRQSALSSVVFGLALNASVFGEIINVPGDQPSIQAAIVAAADGDEIIVAPGTYFENINLLGKAVTLRSSAGPEVTTIDASGSGTVVTCDSGEERDTVLSGFTITGGNAESGGGMKIDGSSPTVTNCVFSWNTAGEAGGAMLARLFSWPTVTDCTFSDNTAELGGGIAVDLGGSPTMTNCMFNGNTALRGGGISIGTIVGQTITGCTFRANTADDGGGIFHGHGVLAVTNCTFGGNTAERGGGIFNSSGNLAATNCSFSGNTAESGGAMFNDGTSPLLTNCSFSGNTAVNEGGAIHNGGVYNGGGPTATNCILWNNGLNPIMDTGEAASTVHYSDVEGGWPGAGSNNIDADPLFVDADGPDDIPGTDDDDLRLSPGSPAIDAADNTGVPADTQDLDGDGDTDEPVPVDLQGGPRFVDDPNTPDSGNPDGINPIVDMGAYEFGPPDSCADEDGDGRVTICHIPPGNPDNAHTIAVGVNAVPAHLAHGDHCGPCEEDGGLLNVGSSALTANPCQADFDNDGAVGPFDLGFVLGFWGPNPDHPADLDGDGVVDPLDLALLLGAWGPCP